MLSSIPGGTFCFIRWDTSTSVYYSREDERFKKMISVCCYRHIVNFDHLHMYYYFPIWNKSPFVRQRKNKHCCIYNRSGAINLTWSGKTRHSSARRGPRWKFGLDVLVAGGRWIHHIPSNRKYRSYGWTYKGACSSTNGQLIPLMRHPQNVNNMVTCEDMTSVHEMFFRNKLISCFVE